MVRLQGKVSLLLKGDTGRGCSSVYEGCCLCGWDMRNEVGHLDHSLIRPAPEGSRGKGFQKGRGSLSWDLSPSPSQSASWFERIEEFLSLAAKTNLTDSSTLQVGDILIFDGLN